MIERPFLFEATRMVARLWTGKSPTGIDRVCHAYLGHFAPQAQAVVQHRGVVRILSPRHSDELFVLLADAGSTARRRVAELALRAWGAGCAQADGNGAAYLNVSHTDFDLAAHSRWVRRCRLNAVYFIHDLIPINHPQYCRPRAVRRHRGRVLNALKTAAGIVVNSRSTACELETFALDERLPLPPIAVAPLAGAPLRRHASAEGGGRSYFLALGTIEPRKNHRLLLDVWLRLLARLGAAAPRLVIVGQWGARSSEVRELLTRHPGLHSHVTLITRCPDEELGRWIGGAQALLMPTLAEGFGLPMVEALAMGTPVIASDLPCFREIGQGIPCLLDPADPAAWERTISGFSGPDGDRWRQVGLLAGYRPPTWSGHFSVVEDWLATSLGMPHRTGAPADRTTQRQAAGGRLSPVPKVAAEQMGLGSFRPAIRTLEARP